jgi:hypothetical protein
MLVSHCSLPGYVRSSRYTWRPHTLRKGEKVRVQGEGVIVCGVFVFVFVSMSMRRERGKGGFWGRGWQRRVRHRDTQ